MKTLEKIKKDTLIARKAKDSENLKFLSFLRSEIETVGKSKGNRETTEDEIQSVLKKLIKSNTESLEAKGGGDRALMSELSYLESLRVKMISEDEIKEFIISNPDIQNIGKFMGSIKNKFGSTVDMGLASKLFKESIGA